MSLATVLGAAGFVGSRLTERLRRDGLEVYAPPKGSEALFERDLGVVYYCAGLTADFDARPFDTVEAHATLVAELARRGRFQRLVYLSSTRLYDHGGGGRESDALSIPVDSRRSLYDLTKGLGENLTLTRMDGRGCVARLANVYDCHPGDPGFLPEWLARAPGERDIVLDSTPSVARDYIHVDEVVQALILMAGSAEGIVNVASGELVSNGQLAQVFEAEGWKVSFLRDTPAPPSPQVDISRLQALGLSPQSVLDWTRDYLRGLA